MREAQVELSCDTHRKHERGMLQGFSAPDPEEHASSDLSDAEVSGEDLDLLQQYGGRLSFLRDLDASKLEQCVTDMSTLQLLSTGLSPAKTITGALRTRHMPP